MEQSTQKFVQIRIDIKYLHRRLLNWIFHFELLRVPKFSLAYQSRSYSSSHSQLDHVSLVSSWSSSRMYSHSICSRTIRTIQY
jgi:hypothetical protein